jgi:hypothetical protein
MLDPVPYPYQMNTDLGKHCFRLPALAGVRLRKNKSPPPDRDLRRREPGNILSMRRGQPEGGDWIKVTVSEARKNYEMNLRIMNRKLQPRKFKIRKKICRGPTTGTEAL